MKKQIWKPGNMLYPLPAVLVGCGDADGNTNLLTVAWTGTVCTNPPMLYISVRPERYSYDLIRKSGEFTVNLTTEKLARATDYCGVRSGRDVDKWKETHLTSGKASKLQYAPIVEESPVNLECKVTEVKELGSHHMFLASVEAVQVSEELMGKNGKFELNHAGLLVYSHGEYLNLDRTIGTFGYSVKKKKPGKKKTKK
ncbi:flavin reductase [Mediterraneibacter butyricigenes]|uniref:Flavin reductase n=1 Tax=Mediterraneibacter butyricigenes TaxID=2316025 RepID=A0A391P1V0_9FIRM|nr:flavin reductase family protein [Mediterraneibacter butyricigenes]RGO27829.1 flavin reductase family protein [Dorea sp. OM02-2LB]RGV95419.1 flavin reductase family protein [Ruminococcus sp. AF14-10]GCA65936.1 flavin reductase [Mediterraneibacter butyricigenes]